MRIGSYCLFYFNGRLHRYVYNITREKKCFVLLVMLLIPLEKNKIRSLNKIEI